MNNKRAMYMLVVISILLITLIGYITYIEIRQTDKYTSADTNRKRIVAENNKIKRGSIYDRNMIELAYSEKDGDIMQRRYPYNNMYSHVIGKVSGEDSEGKTHAELSLLEKKYNSYLMGNDESSELKNTISALTFREKVGNDLVLTIDHRLQETAYNAMSGYKGAIVALNPKTGEVLAMVSKPDYNPNLEAYLKEYATYTRKNEGNYFTRATSGAYPPGSTFKIISTASILENGMEEETYNDTTGEFRIKSADGNPENDFVCKNEEYTYSYGETDLSKAFTLSSNVYYTYMGTKLSSAQMQNTAGSFFFNKNIDFDLPVKKSVFPTKTLTEAERAISAIGQGDVTVSPLHMALIGASIANDGVMPKPYLVSKIKAGAVTVDKAKKDELGRVMSKEDAKKIKDLMLAVVENGTGTQAKIQGIEVCGKTGTAENEKTAVEGGIKSKKTHALFVGFAPYDDPEIVVCAVMEYAGFGAVHAAPAARKVMQKYFELNAQ